MDLIERFIKYVKFNTQSNENSNTCPSTPEQMHLAMYIGRDLKEIGLKEVEVDENGYVMATLPSNSSKPLTTIGFIAHMDTAPDFSGENVNPQIIEYKGGDIVLNKEQNIVMKVDEFEELRNYIGQKIITTDGNTLLGADDKAGIAEIVSAMEYLIQHPEIKHPKIRICFTPDEEIGRGADRFDVKKFDADFAYTIDGGKIGELEDETFNAATAIFNIKGVSIHPGSAKDKMINAGLVASQLLTLFPEAETPQNTDKRDGFFHLIGIQGNVEKAKVIMIVRDFDKALFEEKKSLCSKNAEIINKRYGRKVVDLEVKDTYYNMKEVLKNHPKIIEIAKKAMKNLKIPYEIHPIRGGTDGSRLSFMGLPCPNIFTGGHNFHGRFEYLPVESAKKAVKVIVEISKIVAEES